MEIAIVAIVVYLFFGDDIEKYAKEHAERQKRIEKHLEKLANCVREGHHAHGDRSSISTKHWNS